MCTIRVNANPFQTDLSGIRCQNDDNTLITFTFLRRAQVNIKLLMGNVILQIPFKYYRGGTSLARDKSSNTDFFQGIDPLLQQHKKLVKWEAS